MTMLTETQVAELVAERAAARFKRKELNRRRYLRHCARIAKEKRR